MAFHSYTHLIGKLFNAYPLGPPSRVTGTSAWTCVDHLVSRLPPPTINALFRLAFTAAPGLSPLASPAKATRRFIMQKARRHTQKRAPTACRRMVSGTISLPSSGCFSPFPHGTRTLSVSRECLALPDGPGGFTQDSSCPALLRMPQALRVASRTGLSPSAARRSRRLRSQHTRPLRGPTTPDGPQDTDRFGLIPVRSPLLGESLLFSLPAGTKMFQFPAFAPTALSRR